MRYLLSIMGLVAVVGMGYFTVAQYVNVAHGQSSLLVAQSSESVSADGAQVLALLGRLQSLKLDGRIFSSPDFLALQDWGVSITPQTVGRQNPYLPVANASPAVASTTKVALPKSQK